MNNHDAAIAIANFGRFGARTLKKMRTFFASPAELWSATPERLREIGLTANGVSAFVAFRENYNAAAVAEAMQKDGITIVAIDDDDYPALLREIDDPPAALFVRGDIKNLADRKHVAVVGSRHCTEYGRAAGKLLAHRIAQAGVVIVSGLAFGLDEVAHRAAIAANGITLAVLGCGMQGVDNSRQMLLIDQILAANGVIMSEFPLSIGPLIHHFPQRNRIVAGVSQATLVVEAAEESGSLITARLAVECNRDVFMVPGPITSSTSAGTNRFIQDGAQVALSGDDVLQALGLGGTPARNRVVNLASLPQNQARVARILGAGPMHVDDITRTLSLPSPVISAALTGLELADIIEPLGGMRYALMVQVE